MAAVLALLAQAEREALGRGRRGRPARGHPGTTLDGRFQLERRLGQGSTAAGLLVTDLTATGSDAERVLKVALDDEAAARLAAEAEVLRALNIPRIVKIIEGPLVVGGRQALLLESAGTETLTEVLRARTRLSLDLLERYGNDLLDGLVALDKAGVDHRDIKPSNLGVRENRGDRTKHLVLFDFSLTRAPASAISAGTPPYLDPFLTGPRNRYDSAAERYAAAVVLFEMATGATPVYGDGQADPASITDEATIEPEHVRPRTLARLSSTSSAPPSPATPPDRHDTAEAMRSAWQSIFATDATTEPEESNDELARRATLLHPSRRVRADRPRSLRARAVRRPHRRRPPHRRPGAAVPDAGGRQRHPPPDHGPDQGMARAPRRPPQETATRAGAASHPHRGRRAPHGRRHLAAVPEPWRAGPPRPRLRHRPRRVRHPRRARRPPSRAGHDGPRHPDPHHPPGEVGRPTTRPAHCSTGSSTP